MPSAGNETLSKDVIRDIEKRVAAAGDEDSAWRALSPLLDAQAGNEDAAACLLRLVERRCTGIDRAIDILVAIDAAHSDNPEITGRMGLALEGARDIDMLNAPPPEHPLFEDVFDRLQALAIPSRGSDREILILDGLATAARMLSRQHDAAAERGYRRLVELEPDNCARHYNLGLYYKTRGRFRDGMIVNQAAVRLADETTERYEWNLGICATGCGESNVALDVWQRMEQKIRIGRFDLPEGSYPECKVRLAERPVAERGRSNDDPGLEETIWVERLSPCHGIVRSVLYQDLGVDFGDVVLFDGAPITTHHYGNVAIPVFPHLTTLVRSGYQFYDFAATQAEAGQVSDTSTDLERDAVVYAHSEKFQLLCDACWRDPNLDHEDHGREEKHVVTGRIAAPPETNPAHLLEQLDRAAARHGHCRIYVPALCEAAGQTDRVAFEQRRLEMLTAG